MDPVPPDFKIEPLKLESKLRLPQFTLTLKLILVGVGLLLIGGGSFLVFSNGSFSERNVTVTVDGPKEVTSGQRVTYTVHYSNQNKADLTNARLAFVYPSDAIPFKDNTIKTATKEILDLGTIKGKATGDLTFSAYIVGFQGAVKTAKATLSFIPADLTTELEKSGETNATMAALPVPLDVVVPPTIVSGQQLTYIIDYRNQSGEDLSNLRIKMKFPEGFTATQAKDTWDIVTLKQGDGARITITGSIIGREKEAKTLFVTLQKQIPTDAGLVYLDFEKAEASSVIATPLLSANLSLNDSTDYVAHVGDALKYAIRLTNNTNSALTSLTITAKLDGTMYDISTVESTGAFDSRTRVITWNSAVVPELGNLEANQSVLVPFRVKLKSAFPGGTIGTQNSFVKSTIHAETLDVPDVLALDRITADDSLNTRISTAPSLDQKLTISDPQWGTSGPYPPHVDQTTVFTDHWSLVNPSNDMTGAKVTAVVLPGVTWNNQVRIAGTQIMPTYNSKTSTLTWTLGTLPSGVGVTFPAYEVFFQISVTPSANQVGLAVPLLKDVTFDGTDVLTKEHIVRTVSDVTTSSVIDSREGGAVKE